MRPINLPSRISVQVSASDRAQRANAKPAKLRNSGLIPSSELTGSWLQSLMGRRNANVTTVAQANKNARIAWALLANDRKFRSDYAAAGADA